MKGMDFWAELYTFFITIISIIIVCTLLLIVTQIAMVGNLLGITSARGAAITVFYKPVTYETTLLTFTELSYDNIPMKRILNAVAIQRTTSPWMPEANNFVDADAAADDLLDKTILGGKIYLLKIRDPEIIITSSGQASVWQKVSTELFLLNGQPVDLELYVV
jgi:hypothetical protein